MQAFYPHISNAENLATVRGQCYTRFGGRRDMDGPGKLFNTKFQKIHYFEKFGYFLGHAPVQVSTPSHRVLQL